MEIKVLESGKTLLRLELVGKSHTLANSIVKELWNDSEVLVAGYNLKHPQVNHAVLVLETKKKDPKKVLIDAMKRMDKNYQEFSNKFKKIAK